MPVLTWDEVGERRFEAGIDRGVLYLQDEAVPWNGLTGMDENTSHEPQSYYQDGVKYLEHHVLGEFNGTLKAFTYPDEFQQCIGEAGVEGTGLIVHDQRAKSFGMSYRTRLGNDVEGTDYGYEIHLLYNLRAVPGSSSYAALGSNVTPIEFTWALSGVPVAAQGYRPTSHLSIRSTDLNAAKLEFIEEILYGSDFDLPRLPTPAEVIDILESPFTIVDNGDGTWTATGSDYAVLELGDNAFQINGAEVTQLDEDTIEFQTTD